MKNNKTKRSGFKFTLVLVGLVVVTFAVSLVGLVQPRVVAAAGFSMQIVPPSCTDEDGCNICEVVKIFTNAADLVGIFLSSIALVMFIVGGFFWIFSAGVPDRVEKGKKIILGTLTGLAIVFLAWFAVNVIVRVASSSGNPSQNGLGTSTQIFSRDWWNLDYCQPPTPTTCKGYSIGTICGFGDAGCAGSNSCSCYRKLDDSGDDNLCTGDDAKDVAGANNPADKKCFCASQCTRYGQKNNDPTYNCLVTETVYKANPSRYKKATGIACTASSEKTTYLCTTPVTP